MCLIIQIEFFQNKNPKVIKIQKTDRFIEAILMLKNH